MDRRTEGGTKKGEGEPKEGCSVTQSGLARVPSGSGMWGGAFILLETTSIQRLATELEGSK